MKKKERPNMPFLTKHLRNCSICPFCSANNVDGGSFDVNVVTNSSYAVQNVRCISCGKHWMEEFKLVNVVEIE